MTTEVIFMIILAIIIIPAAVGINLWWAKWQRDQIVIRANKPRGPRAKPLSSRMAK